MYANCNVAIDALSLDFTVKFPLSLVVSRKTILRYQLVFRFLLHLKHLEQTLAGMWSDQTGPAWHTRVGVEHAEFEMWRRRVCLLRARMLALVQQIIAFITFDILEPRWRDLEGKLARVSTVDQLLRDHVDFLDSCIEGCMMTNQKMVEVRGLGYTLVGSGLQGLYSARPRCSRCALHSRSIRLRSRRQPIAHWRR